MWKRLLLVTAVSAAMSSMAIAAPLTVGFSQVGSESGWRAAETSVAKEEAAKRGITLKIDQLPGDKAGVVPFPVVAHAKVEDIDILVAIAWIDVKEEKGVEQNEQHHQQPDRVYQRFRAQHDHQRRQKRGIHGNKQSRMVADKTDAKTRAIIAFFLDVEFVNGVNQQALYFCHLGPRIMQ